MLSDQFLQWQTGLGFMKNSNYLVFGKTILLPVDFSLAIVPEKSTFEWHYFRGWLPQDLDPVGKYSC